MAIAIKARAAFSNSRYSVKGLLVFLGSSKASTQQLTLNNLIFNTEDTLSADGLIDLHSPGHAYILPAIWIQNLFFLNDDY